MQYVKCEAAVKYQQNKILNDTDRQWWTIIYICYSVSVN